MADADVIVIGSGFGGAVTACRLAEAGLSVIVLERGQEWSPANFPRQPGDAWVFDPLHPEDRHGWFDIRMFPYMTVIQGAGVGGGSLVYANISVEAKPDTFDDGWPAPITYDLLAPYYATVGQMMEVQKVPETQWPERTRLLRDAATAAGWADRFRPLELAVRFDSKWTYTQNDPFNPNKTVVGPNAHGVEQGTCVHLGDCDLGCPVRARNTLDFNYLAVARNKGATILPLHVVNRIKAVSGGGYQVLADDVSSGAKVATTFTAPRVVVACGSLGSTELLLRSRAKQGLTNLSAKLGKGWSSNGDFLTPALHLFRDVLPTRGPTITAAIDLLDSVYEDQAIFVEDGGFPDVVRENFDSTTPVSGQSDFLEHVTETLRPILSSIDVVRRVMPWFAQSRDAAEGEFSLKNGNLWLEWDPDPSVPTIDAVVDVHRKLATLTGGMALTPLPWALGHDLITPHPLGGCRMGATKSQGVVNGYGEAFGHPKLYVADGSIVPKALGLNPSRTIAALAEHIAANIIASL
jgi:cholesterol oxidase